MSPSTTVSEIGQIAVTVKDVAAARRFYSEILGLSVLFDAGPNLSFLAAGSVRIMLTTSAGAGEAGKNSVLYFKTASLVSTYDAIVARGATPERAPQLTAKMPDHELWMAFVRDPDNNLVGLMEERR
jgi:predicted enzyme related to lactoylglutathione lyase